MKKHKIYKRPTDAELLTLAIPIDTSQQNQVFKFNKILNVFSGHDFLKEALIQNHLASFFCSNLKKLDVAGYFSPADLQRFSNIAVNSVSDNFALYNAVKEIAESFHQKGLSFILLKGMALSLTVYKKNPLRIMSDIDILIEEAKLHDVKTVLGELGFKISDKGGHQSKWHSLVLAPVLKELLFEKTISSKIIQIDVHWGIIKGVKTETINMDRLKNNLIPLNIDGTPILILSPENLLMHLCVNFYKNMALKKEYLMNLCDIVETIKYYKDSINLDVFIKAIKEEGLTDVVFPILLLLDRLDFIKFSSSAIGLLEVDNGKIFIKDGNFLVKAVDEGQYYFGLISGISGLKNKMIFIFSLIFPTPRELLFYCPGYKNKKIIFYYLGHWRRVFIKIAHIFQIKILNRK